MDSKKLIKLASKVVEKIGEDYSFIEERLERSVELARKRGEALKECQRKKKETHDAWQTEYHKREQLEAQLAKEKASSKELRARLRGDVSFNENDYFSFNLSQDKDFVYFNIIERDTNYAWRFNKTELPRLIDKLEDYRLPTIQEHTNIVFLSAFPDSPSTLELDLSSGRALFMVGKESVALSNKDALKLAIKLLDHCTGETS